MKKTILTVIILMSFLWAQNSKPQAFGFVQQLYFENTEHQFDPYLLEALPALLEAGSAGEQTEEVLWMLASVQERNGLHYPALLNFYKILFLFPQSKFKNDAVAQIRTEIKTNTLSDSLFQFGDKIKEFTTVQEGVFGFISFIYQVNCDSLSTALISEIDLFLKQFPGSRYEDILIFWKGRLYLKQNRPYSAIALFRKVLFLYPQSTLVPEIDLVLADTYWRRARMFNEAKEVYYDLINSFSEDKYGGNAQFYLARLMANRLNNPQEADRNYRLFCQNYPEHPFVALAWKDMGDAALKENRQVEARNYYAQSYEKADDDSLIQYVLKKMEEISYRINDFKKAAVVLLLEAKRENSAEKMLRAADLYKNNVKDNDETKRILNRIIKDFPGSSFAEKAKNILADLKH